MKHDIANLQTISEGARTPRLSHRTVTYEDNGQRSLSRNALKTLHVDPNQSLDSTAVARGFQLASGGIKNSFESGLKVLSAASNGALNFTNNSVQNKNVRGIVLGVLGSIFGLSSIKGILGIPKTLSQKGAEDKQAPMLIKAAQWIAGGSIALGSFRALTGGGLMSNPALITGIIIFLGIKTIISSYENDHSLPAKLLEMIGLRDKVKDIANDMRMENLSP